MKITNGAKPVKMPNEIDNSHDAHGHLENQKIIIDEPEEKKSKFSEKFSPSDNKNRVVDKKSLAPEAFSGINKLNTVSAIR
jgi:hypothetical protein